MSSLWRLTRGCVKRVINHFDTVAIRSIVPKFIIHQNPVNFTRTTKQNDFLKIRLTNPANSPHHLQPIYSIVPKFIINQNPVNVPETTKQSDFLTNSFDQYHELPSLSTTQLCNHPQIHNSPKPGEFSRNNEAKRFPREHNTPYTPRRLLFRTPLVFLIFSR